MYLRAHLSLVPTLVHVDRFQAHVTMEPREGTSPGKRIRNQEKRFPGLDEDDRPRVEAVDIRPDDHHLCLYWTGPRTGS